MTTVRVSFIAMLLLLSPALQSAAADPAKKAIADERPIELKTLMTERGKLLWEEHFDSPDTITKNWGRFKGDYSVVDGVLRSAENPADGHHPEMGHKLEAKDVIVQLKVKVDKTKWMGISFSGKEHIARIFFNNPDSFSIVKMSGIGPTTKGVDMDKMRFKWDPDKWYNVLVEVMGSEMIAQIDNDNILYGSDPGLDMIKGRLAVINGGQLAGYDEFRVWEALPNAKWPTIKAKLVEMKAAKGGKKN